MALQRGHIKAQTPEVSDFRALTRADLAMLSEKRPTQTLASLRDTHHRIARAVAAGLRNEEIAALCGTSLNRISILKKDPAFAELVAHYRAVVTVEYIHAADPVIEYLATNALKAQAMLSDKLDEFAEKGEYLPTRDLLGIAELGLDRTGYGKVNKNLNVNVDFAAQLEGARKRSARAKTIDGSPSLAPQQIEGSVSHTRTPRSDPQAPVAPTSRPVGPSSFRRV